MALRVLSPAVPKQLTALPRKCPSSREAGERIQRGAKDYFAATLTLKFRPLGLDTRVGAVLRVRPCALVGRGNAGRRTPFTRAQEWGYALGSVLSRCAPDAESYRGRQASRQSRRSDRKD